MVSSGSFQTNAYEVRYLVFEWNVQQQSIDKNQTTIQWTLKGAGNDPAYWYLSGNFKVIIDGATVYSSASRIQLKTGTIVASGTYTFQHHQDGTKSFSASAEAGIYYYAVNSRGNGTWSLPTIARATQPTTNKATYSFGESILVTLPRASANFTHTIQAGVEGSVDFTTIASNVGTSYSWQVTKHWAKYLKSSNQRLRIKVLTYSSGTLIGEKEVHPQLSILPTSDMKPIVRLTLSDENHHQTTYGGFVRGQSRIKAIVTEQLYEQTTVASRTLTLNGITYQSHTGTSEIIATTNQVVTASVTDARGLTGTTSERPIVFDWYTPRILQTTVSRCHPNGTLSETGISVKVTYQLDIASVNNKNKRTFRIQYKKQSETSWRQQTVTVSSYTQSGYVILPTDGENTWDIQLVVSDSFATYTLTERVGTVYVLVDFHQSGKGIAIGKVSEREKILDIQKDWHIQYKGSMIMDFISEQGLTNGWTWRKWHGGMAECYKRLLVTANVTRAWGSIYASGAIEQTNQAFPFEFKEVPIVTATLVPTGAGGMLVAPGGSVGTSVSHTGFFEVARGTPGNNLTFYLNYHIIGQYK